MLFSALTLVWQLLVLFACCSGLGLALRSFLPREFSLLNKILLSLMGGLFLVVLIPQNLVYLGVPVRISAWLLLGASAVQAWLCRRKFVAWVREFSANGEIPPLAAVILLTVTFHGVVPIQQGLGWYYGKGYEDQLNYVLLAEFLKEEPYRTGAHDIDLHPWLVRTAIEFKKQRIGQSIVTAEISVWSGTDGKGGYAATGIFFLTLLAVCLYVVLRETGADRFTAGSGALLAALLPAVARLSLDGFLSQLSILFVFPFFACLLRNHEWRARNFTLFFSLALTYLVAAYSEIAPIGLCAFIFGVMFVRQDATRAKRLILMSAILLIALMNPCYLPNLIEFLSQQFYIAINGTFMEHMAPNLLSLRGWSELFFGATSGAPFALFFDCCSLLLGILCLTGVCFLSRRDRLIFGAILLPGILVISYLAARPTPSYYPIAKITLTILPLVIGLVFVSLSRVDANNQHRLSRILKKLLCAMIVAAAAAGSVRYYSEVLNNEGLLSELREAHFQNVCRQLEKIKNKRVLVFETDSFLTPWLCYHARHNDVYFDNRAISDGPVPSFSPFSKIPDIANVDLVVTRDRIVDLRAPGVSCLTLIDNAPDLDHADGHVHYWLGPPPGVPVLAFRPISVRLKMRLTPELQATSFPLDLLLPDNPGRVSRGEIWGKAIDVRRMSFPRGLCNLRLFVTAKGGDPRKGPAFSMLAELDGTEIRQNGSE